MGGRTLKRTNLMLDKRKLDLLRRTLRARSNSEAARLAINNQLAVSGIQEALRRLQERGTLEDVFRRAPFRKPR